MSKPTADLDERPEIEAIYRELQTRPWAHQCRALAQCCQFKLTGRQPMVTRGEALYAIRGIRASGRRKLPARGDGGCPLLNELGQCSIYHHRPFGCRTHYCQQAGGGYPRNKVIDLIHRLDALDEALGGEGARSLESVLRQWESGSEKRSRAR